MDVRTVDALPPVIRGAGTDSGKEREQIASWLLDGEAHMITNVDDRKAHNRLQQKIRNIAKNKGVHVVIRYYAETKETGFQAYTVVDDIVNNKKSTKKAATASE